MRVTIPTHNAYVDFPDDMDHGEIKRILAEKFPARPTHDDLAGAAVTGADSLELQDMAPEVKPAVKMTMQEFTGLQDSIEKPFFSLGNGEVYVFDQNALDVKEAIEKILEGDDSEILGYPDRNQVDDGDMTDAAVTKQGEVVTDLTQMRSEAGNGNVAWAAEGEEAELLDRADRVAAAIKTRRNQL